MRVDPHAIVEALESTIINGSQSVNNTNIVSKYFQRETPRIISRVIKELVGIRSFFHRTSLTYERSMEESTRISEHVKGNVLMRKKK